MKLKFNKEKYNIKRLQPRAEDIEVNKCTHEIFSKEDGQCAVCNTVVDPNMCLDEELLTSSVDIIITHLHCMKMVVNSCMGKKEIKAAQKYFDMIPLLQNIDALYNICIEEFNNTVLDTVELNERIDDLIDKTEESKENLRKLSSYVEYMENKAISDSLVENIEIPSNKNKDEIDISGTFICRQNRGNN